MKDHLFIKIKEHLFYFILFIILLIKLSSWWACLLKHSIWKWNHGIFWGIGKMHTRTKRPKSLCSVLESMSRNRKVEMWLYRLENGRGHLSNISNITCFISLLIYPMRSVGSFFILSLCVCVCVFSTSIWMTRARPTINNIHTLKGNSKYNDLPIVLFAQLTIICHLTCTYSKYQ